MFTFIAIITFLSFLLPASTLPTPLEKRGVSSALLSQFNLYSQYAGAAYCKDNNDQIGSISCPSGNCPLVQQAKARSILEFQDVGLTDATGFVAIDDANKLIVVSYRGSASLGNWIGNVNLGFTAFAPCKGCQVHAGFLSSWNDSKVRVKAALTQAKQSNPSYSIVYAGHSLGAAILTLAAAELRQQGFPGALYTFGSPMVGNIDFANFVTNQNGGNYRVTHAFDAVPKLPGYLLNYRHVSPEYWVTTPSGKSAGTGDIQQSSGIFNLWGNQGTLVTSVSDHLYYFNSICACQGGIDFDL